MCVCANVAYVAYVAQVLTNCPAPRSLGAYVFFCPVSGVRTVRG